MGNAKNSGSNGDGRNPNKSSQTPKSIELAETFSPGGKFNELQAKLAADVIAGRLDVTRMNAARGAYANILRMVDLQYKYAKLTGQTESLKQLKDATK